MSALELTSGLLGKEDGKEAEAESDHQLHVRATGRRAAEGLWRMSLEAVDGWTCGPLAEEDEQGAVASLLGAGHSADAELA